MFTEQQLLQIYLSKLDKGVREAVTLYLLFKCQGDETLAQTFAMVEFLEKAFDKQEATGLITSIMEAAKAKKPPIATSGLGKAQREKIVECCTCGEIGHVMGHSTCSKKEGGLVKAMPKAQAAKCGKKTGGKKKKPLVCFLLVASLATVMRTAFLFIQRSVEGL